MRESFISFFARKLVYLWPLGLTVIISVSWCDLYRGSYMSAHVLMNLLNELGKRDKMRGLPCILSFSQGV